MGVIIFANVIQMITQIDRKTTCEDEACNPYSDWITNVIFLAIYTAEVTLRLFVVRGAFFLQPLSLLDLTVVLLGLAEVFLLDVVELPNLKMLRLFRVTRVSRIARLLKHFPTLYVLVRGFTRAMEAMMWGFFLIMVMLVLWAMIAVDTIHDISRSVHSDSDDEWCTEAFSSTVRATLYFFQTLVAADEWGTCAIPVIRASPFTYTIFAGALVSVQLGFANLIVAIIVDRAVQARDADNEEVIKEKRATKIKFTAKLRKVLEDVDEDRSGTISVDEMMHGYDKDPSVRNMLNLMDLDRADLHKICNLMGGRHGEEVSHNDFVNVFQKAQLQDWRVYLMVMNLQIQNVVSSISEVKDMLPSHVGGKWSRDHVSRASSIESLPTDEVPSAAATAGAAEEAEGPTAARAVRIACLDFSSVGGGVGPPCRGNGVEGHLAGEVREDTASPASRSVLQKQQQQQQDPGGEEAATRPREPVVGTLVLDQELRKFGVSLRARLGEFSRDVAEGAAMLAREAALLELETLAAVRAGQGDAIAAAVGGKAAPPELPLTSLEALAAACGGQGDAIAAAVGGKAAPPELPLTSLEALAAACGGQDAAAVAAAGVGGKPDSPEPPLASLEAFATRAPGKEIEAGVCAQADPQSDGECASNDGAKDVACWCPMPRQRRPHDANIGSGLTDRA